MTQESQKLEKVVLQDRKLGSGYKVTQGENLWTQDERVLRNEEVRILTPATQEPPEWV